MLGFAVIAAYQTAVAGQPGQACLDDPAVPAQSLGGLDALAGDPHLDATPADLGPQGSDVIRLIRVEFLRSLAWPAALAPHRDDRLQQRQEELGVGDVRTGDQDGERDPVAVAEDVELRARLAPADRVWPRLIPPFSARTLIASATALDQSISPITPSLCKNC